MVTEDPLYEQVNVGHPRKSRYLAEERALRWAAVTFAVGLVAHGVDHALRGYAALTPQVSMAGNVQVVAVLAAFGLVFSGHRFGPVAALVVGGVSALGFATAHLLPTWSAFSDSYVTPAPGAGVTAYSWVTAVLEIGTALLFACAGWRGMRAGRA